jgi:hypothetical protein
LAQRFASCKGQPASNVRCNVSLKMISTRSQRMSAEAQMHLMVRNDGESAAARTWNWPTPPYGFTHAHFAIALLPAVYLSEPYRCRELKSAARLSAEVWLLRGRHLGISAF